MATQQQNSPHYGSVILILAGVYRPVVSFWLIMGLKCWTFLVKKENEKNFECILVNIKLNAHVENLSACKTFRLQEH